MKFIRNHNDLSLVTRDEIIEKHSHMDKLEPEVFDNLTFFRMQTANYDLQFFEEDKIVEEIIESCNWFTIISKKGKKKQCIKFSDVLSIEFED